jgi:galactose-1-phosphate uridylyltransferase
MKVEDLKNMSSSEVKDFIRQRLMYSTYDLNEAFHEFINLKKTQKNIHTDLIDVLFKDIRVNKYHHKRFDMSTDCDHNKRVLNEFEDLLKDSFNHIHISFYKGSGNLEYQKTESSNIIYKELGGYGTIEIMYIILDIAWGLKQDQ